MPNPVMQKRTVDEVKHSFVKGSTSKRQALKRLEHLAEGETLVSDSNPHGSRRPVIQQWQEERRAHLRSA